MSTTTDTGIDTIGLAELLKRLGNVPVERVRLRQPLGHATEEEYVRYAERTGRGCELIDGVIVEKSMGYYESRLAAELIRVLGNFLVQNPLGIVLAPDGMVRIEGQVRMPDVAFYPWSEFPSRRLPRAAILAATPALAVEVISPSNTEGEMERKRRDVFLAGTMLFWQVYPDETARARLHRPSDIHRPRRVRHARRCAGASRFQSGHPRVVRAGRRAGAGLTGGEHEAPVGSHTRLARSQRAGGAGESAPGATNEQIRAAEAALGVTLPKDVKACYRIHDGQVSGGVDVPDFLHGWRWNSLSDMVDDWRFLNHPTWIPVANNQNGDFYCLDLTPNEDRKVGRVILWWHDLNYNSPEDVHVAAVSFTAWLRDFADELEEGEWVNSEEFGGLVREDELDDDD